MLAPPIIYNLFPRLVGDVSRWPAHAERAHRMGFNWVYVNPFQYSGFSGSLYAIKNFYRLNPLFIPEGAASEMDALADAIDAMHRSGVKVMMDLVVAHTSRDSELIKEHPTWFRRDENGHVVSPSAIDPADARNVTVWGDLAEVDNLASDDRQGLWAYWTATVQHYLRLGFDGFRCDAAYKVPAPLWDQLIATGRRERPDVVFAAETLGCRLPEIRALADCGFDYLFNSSKWWAFDAPWCFEQHAEFSPIAPSIAFAETHDTARLMEDSGGRVAVQKQRHAFAATFSAGLLMPVGYEFGFRKQLHVVDTSVDDWEETGCDLSEHIGRVNRLKLAHPVLAAEGRWSAVSAYDQPTVTLRKDADGVDQTLLLIVNKDWNAPQTAALPIWAEHFREPPQMARVCTDAADFVAATVGEIALAPAEVVYFVGEGVPFDAPTD